ncbi:MAG: hypothetical protein ACK5PF_07405 [bacterium]|jgi:hypothetical protein
MSDDLIREVRERARSVLDAARLSPGESERLRCVADSARTVGPLDAYTVVPTSFAEGLNELAGDSSTPARRRALFRVIQQLVLDQLDSGTFAALPPRCRAEQLIQLRRLATLPDDQAEWLGLNSDILHKELGLASLRLHAAAAQLIDPRCGVPRSLVLKGGVSEVASRAASFASLGGFKPLFQIHTHLSYLDRFDEEGWDECYRVCAELFAVYPACLGMFGASWFYDPNLETISPRLGYLREVPSHGGARLMLMADEGHFVQDAIATSPTRRKLYESGQYKPRSFMLVWGRADMLQWASQHPGTPAP